MEFFGIDLGIHDCEVCASCGSEFLDDETLAQIEVEVKKKKLFGLEQRVQVTKSGNSLVIRIPTELVHFTSLKYKDMVRLHPVQKNRLEIEMGL